MKKNISIIIPVYNEETSIAACLASLQSLQGSTLKSVEIVVVDDGSTDKTGEVVKQYPVKLLRQKHRGPGQARNLGAKNAKGEILVFVDADMTFAPDFMEKLTAPIFAGETKGVFNIDEFVGNSDKLWARYWNLNQNLRDKRRLNPKSIHDIKDFRAIDRKEFEKVGGFSGRGYTDSQSLSEKLGYLPTPIEGAVSYHNNPGSLKEVFLQARWIGRRPMRWGRAGQLLNLARYSPPASIIIGLIKEVYFQAPLFLLFKLTYDLGFFLGIVGSLAGSTKAK